MPAIGFTINLRPQAASDNLLVAFKDFAVANISDAMSRTTGTYNLRPYHGGAKLCGRALTVRTRPGDNLMVHKAIDLAGPGDVIVVDAGGVCTNAIVGEIMTTLAARRGAAGIIIDGAIRDTDTIGRGDFPVFARGVAHRGPYKDGPGEINATVAIDGMVVNPGDIIVGDADGLIAIALSIAGDVAALVRKIQLSESALLAEIAAGTVDRSWVDLALKNKGVLST
jgi:regulator of RNase E activity RraA